MSDVRAFVAITLPEAARSAVTGIRQYVGEPGGSLRWVRVENVHLTLKFLGDVPTERVEQICTSLASLSSRHAPLALATGDPGAFPNWARLRVLWVGLKGDLEPLGALRDNVEDALAGVGFARDPRAFAPHLTVARSRQGSIHGRGLADRKVAAVAFSADSFSLMQSELRPGGAVYTELSRFPLLGEDWRPVPG